MTKGIKTSELWIVAAVLAPYIASMLGLDLTSADVIGTQEQVEQIAESLRGPTGDTGNGPVLLAGVYVAGRILLKWRAGGINGSAEKA